MSDDLRRGTKLGKYELLLRIGRGGMATVWVARERAAGVEEERLVAVKAILAELASDPEFNAMFLDEGRLVQSIRHPNVVDVYEVGEDAGVMYMGMEWVEGDSLHAVIAEAGKRRPIPPEMAVRMIADAAAGLHAAHELRDTDGRPLGVVHRDVSPHNILIGTDGAIKLVDFGVAKAMGRLADATSAGQLKGKFGYMSPEQAMAKPIDRRSDIFSLGIVLFELTTGRRLFRGEHDAETLHLVVSGEIPRPTSIDATYPPALERIVMKALERDVDRRYAGAEALQKDLETYLKQAHIVVARAGVAGLLKRVLGARIEQRRKAVRATLRQLDGGTSGIGLISSDPAFTPTGRERISVSGMSSITGSELELGPDSSSFSASSSHPSSIGDSQPSSATHATSPQTVTRAAEGRRGGMIGYAIGLGGLALALVVVLVYALSPRRTTTTIVTMPAAQGVGAQRKPAAAPQQEVPTVSFDKLEAIDAGAAARGSRPQGRRPAPAERPAEAPKKPSTAGALPRDNPYQ